MSSIEARLRHSRLIALALLVLAAACSDAVENGAPDAGQRGQDDDGSLPAAAASDTLPGEDTVTPAQTSPEPPSCRVDRRPDEPVLRLEATDAVQLSLDVAGRTHRCAPTAVVAPAHDHWASTIAAPAAMALDAPLLLLDDANRSTVASRLRALDTRNVLAINVDGRGLPGRITHLGRRASDDGADDDVEESADAATDQDAIGASPDDKGIRDEGIHDEGIHDEGADVEGDPGDGNSHHLQLAIEVAGHLGVTRLLAVPESDHLARTAALARADGDAAILPIPDDRTAVTALAATLLPTARLHVLASDARVGAATSDALLAVGLDAVQQSDPLFPRRGDTSWLVDDRRASALAVSAVAAASHDESLLPVDAADLRRGRAADRLRSTPPERVILVGGITSDASWQLPLILAGPELPGGGFTLFDDERIVAVTEPSRSADPALDEEQHRAETLARLTELVAAYGAEGTRVLPAVDLVTTDDPTAAGHGDDAGPPPVQELRPWVDLAADQNVYVVIQLQAGAADLLARAREYEALLREPHVGLGLTSTRLSGSEQQQSDEVGPVDDHEVQDLAAWLAELTRRNNLPQKLLLLPQDPRAGPPDRDSIAERPELAMVLRVEDQGILAEKLQRYAATTDGIEDHWRWGWGTSDELDDPPASPEQVLGLEPPPVFVSHS